MLVVGMRVDADKGPGPQDRTGSPPYGKGEVYFTALRRFVGISRRCTIQLLCIRSKYPQ